MFKLLRRLICLTIILAIVFIVLALESGGKKFRWFGETVKEKTEEIGNTADKIKETAEDLKETAEDLKDTAEEAAKTIKKTSKKIKNLTSE